jgi:hypothetical protein
MEIDKYVAIINEDYNKYRSSAVSAYLQQK